MSTYRPSASVLVPALMLVAAVGVLRRAPRRDVGALADAPAAVATVEAALGTVHERPIEGQVVTVEAPATTSSPRDRAGAWLRTGSRPACRDALADAAGPPASHPGEPAHSTALDGIAAQRRAAFAGRRAAPTTAPPTRVL